MIFNRKVSVKTDASSFQEPSLHQTSSWNRLYAMQDALRNPYLSSLKDDAYEEPRMKHSHSAMAVPERQERVVPVEQEPVGLVLV